MLAKREKVKSKSNIKATFPKRRESNLLKRKSKLLELRGLRKRRRMPTKMK